MNELEHSAKGTTWGKHKYIRIENGRYIYADSKGSRDASVGEIRDRLKNFKLTKSSKSSSKSSSSSKKSSEKKEGSSKSGSAKEKTATEKTSKASGSTDEKKVETSSNEYQKETKSVDEHYAELLEKLRAKKNTSLLPQIRERQAMLERKKMKHMDDMYDGVILKPSMDDILEHHGIKGQKWGVRNGPPYPLKSHAGVGKPTNGGIKTKKS